HVTFVATAAFSGRGAAEGSGTHNIAGGIGDVEANVGRSRRLSRDQLANVRQLLLNRIAHRIHGSDKAASRNRRHTRLRWRKTPLPFDRLRARRRTRPPASGVTPRSSGR